MFNLKEKHFSELPVLDKFSKLWYRVEKGDFWRISKENVILNDILTGSIKKLNPSISQEQIDQVLKNLSSFTSKALAGEDIFNLNKNLYEYFKEGFPIQDTKTKKTIKIKLFDFSNPENNDFLVINQFEIKGKYWEIRIPDLVVFVNGIPLVFFEFKAPNVNLVKAYEDNIERYRLSIPQIFVYNAWIVISNWVEARAGSTFANFNFYKVYNKILKEDELAPANIDRLLDVMFEKIRFMDFFENFILFWKDKRKILAQNHQFIWVNKAFNSVASGKKKIWVFRHTQWSWKSLSMAFLAQKIRRKLPWNWTFLVVTDRKELDKQIYDTFSNFGLVQEENVQAESIKHLSQLLGEDHKFIFTLIHKFTDDVATQIINERDDIIVMVDEAHRTQYWQLAANMRKVLPNARYIAFTGTPLLKGDKITTQVFGDYVSIYNFAAAIKDWATVEIFYENRKPKLGLKNPDLDKNIIEIFEKYGVDEEDENLSRRLGKLYNILTVKDRLEKVAEDIVNHYFFQSGDWKAIVVTMDKITAYKMYFLIKEKIENLKQKLEDKFQKWEITSEELNALKKIKNFDLAVVVSLSDPQKEIERAKKFGIDATEIIQRLKSQWKQLEKLFKNPDSNLKMVIVVSMWITGFDVPALRTLYLDKPMANHTLMQTIARVNRIFPWKENWLVLDYVWIFKNLKQALADYASSSWDLPLAEKKYLFEKLESYINEFENLLKELSWYGLQNLASEEDIKQNLTLIISKLNKSERDRLKIGIRKIISVYESILPDPDVLKYRDVIKILKIIYTSLAKAGYVDIDSLKSEINELIDKSVKVEDIDIKNVKINTAVSRLFDKKLEKDFKTQLEKIKKLPKQEQKLETESLINYIDRRISKLKNKTITAKNLAEKLKKIIEKYNSQEDLILIIEELKDIYDKINTIEDLVLKSGLTDEEYKLFEKLSQTLRVKNTKKLQQAVKNLYSKIKEILDLYQNEWKNYETQRWQVRSSIKREIISLCKWWDVEKIDCKQNLIKIVDDVFNFVLQEF